MKFFFCNLERKYGHVGDEGDILEDLGPADVRVLLQAEEELGQVLLMSQCFTPARDMIANKADVPMFYSGKTKFEFAKYHCHSLVQCQQWERVFPKSDSSLDHLLLPESG